MFLTWHSGISKILINIRSFFVAQVYYDEKGHYLRLFGPRGCPLHDKRLIRKKRTIVSSPKAPSYSYATHEGSGILFSSELSLLLIIMDINVEICIVNKWFFRQNRQTLNDLLSSSNLL